MWDIRISGSPTAAQGFEHEGILDCNEAEVLAIMKALWIFSVLFQGMLVVESDSSNVAGWVSKSQSRPWKFQFCFSEIKESSSTLNVVFHCDRMVNRMADALAKQGENIISPWASYIMLLFWQDVGYNALIL